MIFDLLGTPSEAEIAELHTEEAKQHIRALARRERKGVWGLESRENRWEIDEHRVEMVENPWFLPGNGGTSTNLRLETLENRWTSGRKGLEKGGKRLGKRWNTRRSRFPEAPQESLDLLEKML